MQKKLFTFILFLSSALAIFFIGYWVRGNFLFNNAKSETSLAERIIPKPLEAYTIENLSKEPYPEGKVEMVGENIFKFTFQPNPEKNETKATTGVVNIPEGEGKFPLVVMIRGYVDPTVYSPGVGTKRAAEVFNKNGFMTVAPDFLGYAESDTNSSDIFESRFQTYTLILSLLNSLDQFDKWDGENISIWAHSNGGQIALTTLAVTQRHIPTVLWAPVSKSFPYSILYYTDESADRGKLIRRELAKFEELYDPDKFSFDIYLDRIHAPIQIHQGTADDAIPVDWSTKLSKDLKELYEEKEANEEVDEKIEAEYWIYPGADHNLQPGWDTAIVRSLNFLQRNTK